LDSLKSQDIGKILYDIGVIAGTMKAGRMAEATLKSKDKQYTISKDSLKELKKALLSRTNRKRRTPVKEFDRSTELKGQKQLVKVLPGSLVEDVIKDNSLNLKNVIPLAYNSGYGAKNTLLNAMWRYIAQLDSTDIMRDGKKTKAYDLTKSRVFNKHADEIRDLVEARGEKFDATRVPLFDIAVKLFDNSVEKYDGRHDIDRVISDYNNMQQFKRDKQSTPK